MTNATDVQALIARHGDIVDFGSPADAVGEDWIERAEAALNRPLPASYKWFLRQFGGGEVGGEEIFSIYGEPFETVDGGDIVFQHLAARQAGLFSDSCLIISATDFGEVFYFDYTRAENAECPIHVRQADCEVEHYADNFYQFLALRIAAHRRSEEGECDGGE